MEALPVEILHRILDYVLIVDLRVMAHVSTRVRAVATTHSDFHLPFRMNIAAVEPEIFSKNRLDVLDHCQRFNLPISFCLSCYSSPSPMTASQLQPGQQVLSRLREVLHLIVVLELYGGVSILTALVSSLCSRAPLLRRFSLRNSDIRSFVIPPSIFQGDAPKLKTAHLDRIGLGNIPVPAFGRIYCLQLSYDAPAFTLSLQHHFPGVKRLFIDQFSNYNSIVKFQTDVRGFADLMYCEINTGEWPLPGQDLSLQYLTSIRVLTWISSHGHIHEPEHWPRFWAGLTGPVVLHAGVTDESYYDALYTSVTSVRSLGNPPLQRNAHYGFFNSVPFHHTLLFFASRIVRMRLECDFISLIFKFDEPHMEFPVLQILHIDVVGWRNEPRDRKPMIQCNNLHDVLVIRLAKYEKSVAPLSNLLLLGYLLGQADRSPQERPAVRALGITFDCDIDHTSLFDVYSSFESSPSGVIDNALDLSGQWSYSSGYSS